MKYALAILVLLSFSAPMRADSVTDFTFSFTGPGYSGSGSFVGTPVGGVSSDDTISSLDGTMNGQAMDLVSGTVNTETLSAAPFLYAGLLFSIGGQDYLIAGNDMDPYLGPTIIGRDGPLYGAEASIAMTVTDPAPPTVPEPGVLELCSIGLLAVAAGFLARRVAVGS
jgi:hypothetical protein